MVYKTCKCQEIKILVGDFLATVGRGKHETVVGPLDSVKETIGETLSFNGARKRKSRNECLISTPQ